MKKYLIIIGLIITASLTVLTAKADDDITATRNQDGSWTFIKPVGSDVKLQVVYYTKEELDSIAAQTAAQTSFPLPEMEKKTMTDNDNEELEEDETASNKKKSTKKRRNRRRSRRR